MAWQLRDLFRQPYPTSELLGLIPGSSSDPASGFGLPLMQTLEAVVRAQVVGFQPRMWETWLEFPPREFGLVQPWLFHAFGV